MTALSLIYHWLSPVSGDSAGRSARPRHADRPLPVSPDAVAAADPDAASRIVRDAEWMARVQGGDEEALVQLMRAYAEPLRNYVAVTVGAYDVANDIIQNLWIWLWERRAAISVRGSVQSYLYRAARNRALNAVRDARTQARVHADAVREYVSETRTDDAMQQVESESVRTILYAVIEQLRPPAREICMLRFEQDMSYADIADILGIPPVNVRMTVSRVTRRLIERLRETI